MRKHEYTLAKVTDESTLLLDCVDSWLRFSERVCPPVQLDSALVDWHCYQCSKSIKVNWQTSNIRSLYCDRCRPVRLYHHSALQLRYMNMFKTHVRNTILKNNGLLQ
jgi:hypothetical protein